jgi:osmoprotectant transport system substrate-binding protein
MNARRPLIALLAAGVLTVTAACGDPGSSGTQPSTAASASGGSELASCDPVAGDALVVLDDDKNLQTVDNVIPAVNAAASTPALLDALNAVSTKLTTQDLTDLISAVNDKRQSAVDAASAYVKDKGLAGSGGSGAITVGAADFPESQILANVYADVLNAAGFQATVQTVGKREVYIPALQRGEIQVFPEYVGSLATFLNGSDPSVASSDLQKTVDNLTRLGQGVGLAFGEPSKAADQNGFAITSALSKKLGGITSLSDLADKCGDGSLVLGGPTECPTRPFCQPGLEDKYGLKFADVQDLDIGTPINQGLVQGVISIGLVLTTDPVLAK